MNHTGADLQFPKIFLQRRLVIELYPPSCQDTSAEDSLPFLRKGQGQGRFHG